MKFYRQKMVKKRVKNDPKNDPQNDPQNDLQNGLPGPLVNCLALRFFIVTRLKEMFNDFHFQFKYDS